MAEGSDPALKARALRILGGTPGVTKVMESEGGVVAYTKNAEEIVIDIVTALDRDHIRPDSLSIASPSLDDVFLHQTGRRIRVRGTRPEGDRSVPDVR